MIVEPKDDVVMESYVSEDVQLQCELSRSSGKVRWFKDGQLVEESPNLQLISEGPYRRLSILTGTVSDGGEYVCQTDGDSVFFQLTVKGKIETESWSKGDKRASKSPPPPSDPPVRIISPSEPEVELTHVAPERLQLGCEVSKAEAPVRWFRDGLEVKEGPNLTLEADGAQRRLIVPVTTVDDTGEYVCDTEDDSVVFVVTVTGENLQGQQQVWFWSLTSSSFTSEPPVKLSRPQNVPENLEGCAGEPIVLETEVSRPNAAVKWWLNGREIVESSNVTMTTDGLTRRLTIHSPTPEDSGTYSCDVVDDEMDFHVTVRGEPLEKVGVAPRALVLTRSSRSIRAASQDPEQVRDQDTAPIPGV